MSKHIIPKSHEHPKNEKSWIFFRTDVRYSMTPLSGILSATAAKLECGIALSIAVWFYLVNCSGSPIASHSTYRARQDEASDLFELIGLSQMRDAKKAQGSLGRYGIATLIMA